MKPLYSLLLVLSSSFSIAHAESGWSGGGGDGFFTQDNIWNLGHRTINYCLKKSDNYPLDESELSQIVHEAFEEWKTFFQKYGLDGKPLRFKSNHSISDYLLPPNFNFKESSQCKDTADSKDIRFYFGIKNDIISTYTKFTNAELKLGAALRPPYDHTSYANGGIVWIENFSQSHKKIKHLVLHEIGHIFGMKHDSVFVMSENIGEILTSPKIEDSELGTIESESWPFMMAVGDVLELSSRRGKIISRDGRQSFCEGRSMLPNRLLPDFLARKIGLDQKGCHRITLAMIKENGPHSQMRLTIATPQGIKLTLVGEFKGEQSKRRESLFPSVQTRGQDGRWKVALTGPDRPDLPAKGYFLWDGKKVPAQIDLDQGINLELFLGEHGQWFSTTSY